jgi:hypothetical protein
MLDMSSQHLANMKPRTLIAGTALSLMIATGFVVDPSYEPVGWSHSQTVPVFDTPTGELRRGEYSVTDTGQILANVTGEMESLENIPSKMTLVDYVGTKAEHIYKDGSKSEATAQEYEQVKRSELKPEKYQLKLGLFEEAEAAISITGTSSVHTSYVNSVTYALNCTGATDPGVLVFISNRTLGDITGVTYNGDTMINDVQSLNNNVTGHEVWSRTAADIGNFNVVISNSQFRLHTSYAICLSGTDQTNLVEATTSVTNGFSSSITGSVTSLTDNAWIFTGLNLQNNYTLTPDSGETELYDDDNSDSNLGRTGVSYLEKATAGSETMGWTWGTNDNHAMILLSVKPSVSELPATYNSTLKGGMNVRGGVIIK